AVKPTVPESVGSKPGGLESREEKAALAKTVGEKPPAEKPVAAKPETVNPATAGSQVEKPVAAKPAETKPPSAGPVEAESERVKPAAAKPVEVQPKETVSEEESAEREEAEDESNEEETAEGVTVEEVTTEELVAEMPSTMQHEEALGSHPVESVEQGVRAISSHNTEHASNALPLTIADSPNILGTTHEELDSNFFRNVIMAIAFQHKYIFIPFTYSFMCQSSRLESSIRKNKKKKGKIFEHNYYEEYEKELTMYGSEETFLDSETDRLYLNYHPDQDSYY
ncbi:PIR protein, partial [Plasmodium vivax]